MTEQPTDDDRPVDDRPDDEPGGAAGASGGAGEVPFDDWFGDDGGDGDVGWADADADDHEGSDPRVQDGVEHLQRAAREMLSASRAFLDVVEELVERPEVVQDLLGAVGSLGDLAGRAIRTGGRPAGTRNPAPREARGEGDDPDDPPPVQRIPVS